MTKQYEGEMVSSSCGRHEYRAAQEFTVSGDSGVVQSDVTAYPMSRRWRAGTGTPRLAAQTDRLASRGTCPARQTSKHKDDIGMNSMFSHMWEWCC